MISSLRQAAIESFPNQVFDVVIVGGGINGAVSAASLAAAGVRVALFDKGDFASSTSQESSNLVWGGIKYLESYEFGLVWNLCRSRNELMRRYPSSVTEVRFFTNLDRGFRKPRILVFLGALLYWFMGRMKTRLPRLLSAKAIHREEPIVDTARSQGGLEYSDCYLKDNDARFVFQFIRRAEAAGAKTLNYAEVLNAKRGEDGLWDLTLRDHATGREHLVKSRVFINAAGPYADSLNRSSGVMTRNHHVFSKGVHLIVPRVTDSERVLTFFADDGRLFFVIPMGARSCIGTTDTRVDRLPAVVTEEDRDFILANINKRLCLSKALTRADVIAERCGVRPLVVEGSDQAFDDWMNLSRKHAMEIHKDKQQISIFGGKLTDCLNIGREVRDAIEGLGFTLRKNGDWFGESPNRSKFIKEATELGLAGISQNGEGTLIDRLWRCYDEDAFGILQSIKRDPKMKETVAGAVLMAEVKHIAEHEQVLHLDDFLRRRTRLALVTPKQALRDNPKLKEAAQLLFADKAEAEWLRYFGNLTLLRSPEHENLDVKR